MPDKLSGYRSEEELFFSKIGPAVVAEVHANHRKYTLRSVRYEPFRMAIPGGSYMPDFELVLAVKRDEEVCQDIIFVEVKGSTKQRGYRTSRIKLRAAASLYPEFSFYQVMVNAAKSTIDKVELIRLDEWK